jgi:Family of unknown function (DUF6527)
MTGWARKWRWLAETIAWKRRASSIEGMRNGAPRIHEGTKDQGNQEIPGISENSGAPESGTEKISAEAAMSGNQDGRLLFPIVQTGETIGYYFWCPACRKLHPFYVSQRPTVWQFNGDQVKPSFTPSLKVLDCGCHLFVREGTIQYCDDCGHSMKGQTVPMVPLDEKAKPVVPETQAPSPQEAMHVAIITGHAIETLRGKGYSRERAKKYIAEHGPQNVSSAPSVSPADPPPDGSAAGERGDGQGTAMDPVAHASHLKQLYDAVARNFVSITDFDAVVNMCRELQMRIASLEKRSPEVSPAPSPEKTEESAATAESVT